MQLEQQQTQGPVVGEPGLEAQIIPSPTELRTIDSRAERLVRASFIWPALLVVLLLSVFPLLISLYLSLSRLQFVKGGFDVRFVGLENYRKLLFGSGQSEFLGVAQPPSPLGWVIFLAAVGLLAWLIFKAARTTKISPLGLILRVLGALFGVALLWLGVQTVFGPGGRPGS